MSENVIISLISLIGTIIGTFGGILVGTKLLTYRVEQLEKQVAKHNNLIERTYKLEQDRAVFEEQLKVANHRIDDLERKAEAVG